MPNIPGYAMSDEPYTLTEAQIDALNLMPPGVYHVCWRCRKFQPMSRAIHFTNEGILCEVCADA